MGDLGALFAEWTDVPRAALAAGAWVFEPCIQGGEIAGVGALRGFEIHFAAAPAWRGRLISRRTLREFLGPLFNRLGFLTTRVLRGDEGRGRFIERLGFQLTRSDETTHYYMLSAVPFSREN
jgi:GNAT superfamily N-acetyltransferase